MPLRFQKRVRIIPGLSLNLSRTGVSWSVGGRGLTMNLRKGKVTGTVGIPGTGLSYRQELTPSRSTDSTRQANEPAQSGSSAAGLVLILIILLIGIGIGMSLR